LDARACDSVRYEFVFKFEFEIAYHTHTRENSSFYSNSIDMNASGDSDGSLAGFFTLNNIVSTNSSLFLDTTWVDLPVVTMNNVSLHGSSTRVTGVASNGVILSGGRLTWNGGSCTNYHSQTGGCINADGDVHLSNVVFSNSSATGDGGCVLMGSGTIENSHFVNCVAMGRGGAMAQILISSNISVVNCTFSNNRALDGGDMFFSPTFDAALTLINVVSNNASVSRNGGSIYCALNAYSPSKSVMMVV
jgi:hypothetical protein